MALQAVRPCSMQRSVQARMFVPEAKCVHETEVAVNPSDGRQRSSGPAVFTWWTTRYRRHDQGSPLVAPLSFALTRRELSMWQ